MKRLTLLLTACSLLLALPLVAQQKIGETPIKYKKAETLSLASAPDSSFTIFTKAGQEHYYYAFSKDGTLTSEYKHPTYEKIGELLGVVSHPDRYVYYIETPNIRALRVVTLFKKGGGAVKKELVFSEDKKEIIIASIADLNKVYVILYNKKSNKLAVVELLDELNFNRREFNLSEDINPVLKTRLLNGMINVSLNDVVLSSAGSTFKIIKSTQTYSVEDTYHKKKVYLQKPHKLLLTIDYDHVEGSFNKMINLDMLSGEAVIQTFPERIKLLEHSSNSFYYKNHLYHLYLTEHLLNLHIIDAGTGKVVKQYKFSQNDELSILRGSIVQEITNYGLLESDPATWDTTKKKLWHLSKGTTAIAVSSVSEDEVRIQLGSYMVEQRSGGMSGGSILGGGTLSTPYGSVPLPSTSINTSMAGSSSTIITYFYTYLSLDSFAPTDRQQFSDPADLLKNLASSLEEVDKIKIDQKKSITETQNTHLFALINKSDKKLELYRLNNKLAEIKDPGR